MRNAIEAGQHCFHFAASKYYWEFPVVFGAFDIGNEWQILFKHFAVKKKERAESYCLRRGGDSSVDREIGDILPYLDFAHFPGMALIMEKNESPDPGNVSPLRAQAEVLDTNDSPDLIQ